MALRQATAMSMAMLFLLAFNGDLAVGHKYYVGDHRQWNLMVWNWTTGKSFHEGDTLVFKYRRGEHNVLSVKEDEYNFCRVPEHSKVYESGNDHIKLEKGKNYFICGISGHCVIGMKILADAK